MDASRTIPQLFYDLIARLIPGGVALVLASPALEVNLLAPFLRVAGVGIDDPQKPTTLVLTAMLAASYVIGQLLAPCAQLTEAVAHRLQWTRPHDPLVMVYDNPKMALPGLVQFVQSHIGTEKPSKDQLTQAVFVWYDWLRVHRPGIGSFAAKTRAEYRMAGALAFLFVLAIVVHLASLGWITLSEGLAEASTRLNPWLLAASVVGTPLCLLRTSRAISVFRLSVVNLYYASQVDSNQHLSQAAASYNRQPPTSD